MMQITVSPDSMNIATNRIENKIRQAEYAVSPISLQEIAKSVFTITAKNFIKDISIAARTEPKKYHHLYEWNKIGNPSQKLFVLQRAHIQGGQLVINIETTSSKTFVPIRKELQNPGPTGKTVTARHIFKNKAEIMENGKPLTIYSNRVMAFYVDDPQRDNAPDNIIFISPGYPITVQHPGGAETAGALTEFTHAWFESKSQAVIKKSMIIGRIGNAVSMELNRSNSTKVSIFRAIQNVTREYGQDIKIL